MNFQKYLKLNTAYIQVQNVYKINKNIDVNFQTSDIDDGEYFDLIVDRIEKGEINENTNINMLFQDFLKLGKILYEENKHNLSKIEVSNHNVFSIKFTSTLILENLSVTSEDILKNWIENNFIFTIDKDLENKYFIETTALIDLSIFMYLVTQSFKQYFVNKSDKNKINFNTFIECTIQNPDYLSIIIAIIDEFENRFNRYIRERTKLIYDENNGYIRNYKIFDNVYSLMWYVFKLFLSFQSLENTGEKLYTPCKCCGNNVTEPKSRLCKNCKEKHATYRKGLNRENKKNLEKIKVLIVGQTFPNNLQSRINMILSKKIDHEDNLLIKHLLNDIEIYLKLK